jgi:hypothetical protein
LELVTPSQAALGFRVHTGWAALVAVTGEPHDIKVMLRLRVDLLPSDGSIARFVYHQAAEMERRQAINLVNSAREAAQRRAQDALKAVLDDVNLKNVVIQVACVPTGSTVVPDDLAAILASHPLIHAAEGSLFQQALATACQRCGIKIIPTHERDVWSRAADAYGLDSMALREQIDAVRQTVGPPWGADQKIATVAALMALRVGRRTQHA